MDAAMRSALDGLSNTLNKLMNSSSSSGISNSDVWEFFMYGYWQGAISGDLELFKDMATDAGSNKDGLRNVFSMRDKSGLSLIHLAAMSGNANVIKFLLKQGEVGINMKDWKFGHTALHAAITMGQFTTATCLIDKGANPNAETLRKRTPLHYAAEFGTKKIIQLLISKGAKVNALADCGTPLQFAAELSKEGSLKALLDKHSNPNVMSGDLLSPLLVSIIKGSNECMKILLKAGADPNIRGQKGMTSLGFAAACGKVGALECLLNSKANPNIIDNLGMTPLEVAVLGGKDEEAMILFPVTSPIEKISEWSIEGVRNHVHSDEATQEREQKAKEHILLSTEKGEDAFKRKDYFGAAQQYTQALAYDINDAALLSKRSLCWARLKDGELAMKDAEACLALRPDWPKAHYRVGSAFMVLKDYVKAADAFQQGLNLDPKNQELELAFGKAIEEKKKEPVFFFNGVGIR